MTDPTPPVVLAMAGTDSGGAAGLAADLATIGHLGGHAACVVTAVTAQDTTAVHAIHLIPPAMVAAQLEAVRADLPVAAAKTGMLGSGDTVRLAAEHLADLPLIVDPVLVATSGARLGDADVIRAYVGRLLPIATLVTPNAAEARVLAGRDGSSRESAARLADLGCAVLVTGGDEAAPDWLAMPGIDPEPLSHPRVATRNDHGTGCTHSSAIATEVAVRLRGGGAPHTVLRAAVLAATAYTTDRLSHSSNWRLGRGRGPVAHTAPGSTPPEGVIE
jgi:hydroxymethylpyrimidine/phosphomethylpyrimidine kinase